MGRTRRLLMTSGLCLSIGAVCVIGLVARAQAARGGVDLGVGFPSRIGAREPD